MKNYLDYFVKKYKLPSDAQLPITLSPFQRNRQLIDLFRELGFETGAEIGTERGKYAEILCQGIPNLKLYCIDPWNAYENYPEPWVKDQNNMNAIFEEAKGRLTKYNCKIIRKTSMEAVKNFRPNSLDFVFIDGNHDFEYVINDIIQWAKIVRPDGILAGHDFTNDVVKGVPFHIAYAVRAYTEAYNISPWFVLHHPGTVDCWMWIKR